MTPEVQTAVDRGLRLMQRTDHRRLDVSGELMVLGVTLPTKADCREFFEELDRLWRLADPGQGR